MYSTFILFLNLLWTYRNLIYVLNRFKIFDFVFVWSVYTSLLITVRHRGCATVQVYYMYLINNIAYHILSECSNYVLCWSCNLLSFSFSIVIICTILSFFILFILRTGRSHSSSREGWIAMVSSKGQTFWEGTSFENSERVSLFCITAIIVVFAVSFSLNLFLYSF